MPTTFNLWLEAFYLLTPHPFQPPPPASRICLVYWWPLQHPMVSTCSPQRDWYRIFTAQSYLLTQAVWKSIMKTGLQVHPILLYGGQVGHPFTSAGFQVQGGYPNADGATVEAEAWNRAVEPPGGKRGGEQEWRGPMAWPPVTPFHKVCYSREAHEKA